MFCEQILGNLGHDNASDLEIDWLDLTWLDCARRALRKRTRGGIDVKLVLPIGQTIRHEDIIFHDHVKRIVVHLLPVEVLVVRPADVAEMGRLALELGNLHAPVEIVSDELITIPDGPVEAVLTRMSLCFRVETRRFTPEHCCISSLPTRSEKFSVSVSKY